MKIHLLPLAVLAFSAPALAQEVPPAPAAATQSDDLPVVEPAALRLLAQVAETYGRAGYYAGVVDIRAGEAAATKLDSTRFRLAYSRGNTGVISKSDARGAERWVSDGRQTLATATRRPKEFIQQPLNASGFWRIGRDEFFLRAGFEGILSVLLREQMGDILLEPGLRSVKLGPTTENGATQKIVVFMSSPNRVDWGTVTLFIGDDLLLRRATMKDKVLDNPEGIWDEIYSETVLARETPLEFYDSTKIVPPAGYKRVMDFDPSPEATAPVNNDVPVKVAPAKPVRPTPKPALKAPTSVPGKKK